MHNKFEDALLAEWNIHADAAEVRKAIQRVPSRCQQCKKTAPVLGGDVCTCKNRVKYDWCLSNPRGLGGTTSVYQAKVVRITSEKWFPYEEARRTFEGDLATDLVD